MREILTKTIKIPAWNIAPDNSVTLPDQIMAVLPGNGRIPPSVVEADKLLVPSPFLPVPTRRLVVLVPSQEIEDQALVRRIWQLADCSDLDVLYLALSPDANQASYLRRHLAELAVLTADQTIRTSRTVSTEKTWSRALLKTLQRGDLIVCLTEQSAPRLFFWRRALGEQLISQLNLPVYELGDMKVKTLPIIPVWMKEGLVWAASIALIAAFFWLQSTIDLSSQKSSATLLLFLSVLAEIYCLCKINDWIG